MAFLPTNAAQVQQFAAAMYGIQVGTTTMAQVNADINAAGSLSSALNAYYNVSFGSSTTAAVAASVAANLGLTGTLATDGATYIKGQLDAAPATARGVVISNILNLFSTLSADATFGAAATAWNTKVESAVSYTGSTDAAAGSTISATTAFVFTDKIDALNGTAGNDTFTGDATTISNADAVTGGAGTDTVAIFSAAGQTDVPSMSGVEVVRFVDADNLDLDLRALGVTTAEFYNPTSQSAGTEFTIGNIGTKVFDVAASEVVRLHTSTSTGASLNIALDKFGTSAGVATLDVEGSADRIRTLNISTSGNASFVSLDGSSAHAITHVTFTGDKAIAFDVTNETTIASIDASAHTLGVNATQTAVSQDVTFTGGIGNDRINIGANLSSTDVLNGGDGTDVLAFSNTAGWSASTDAIVVAVGAQKGFEVIEVTDAAPSAMTLSRLAFDEFRFTGTHTAQIVLNGANTDNLVFNTATSMAQQSAPAASSTGSAGVDAIDINPTLDNGANEITITLKSATITGSKAGNGASTSVAGGAGGDGIDASPYETISIVSTGDSATDTGANTIQAGDGGSAESGGNNGSAGNGLLIGTNAKLNISGSNDLTIESVVAQNATVDASKLTGKLTITINDASTDSNDVITGGTNDDIITAGDGRDTVDLSAGGQDTVNLDVVTRSQTVGAASAKVVGSGDRDTIKGFTTGSGTGFDKIDLALASTDYLTQITTPASSITVTNAKIQEFAFEATGNSADLAAATDGTELLKALLTGGGTLTCSNNDTGHIIAYDNGNAYLYYFADSAGVTVTASEIALIAVIENVAVGSFVAANIA
jgi:hypothetical protein